MEIDFSKIKIPALPEKKVMVEFLKEEKEFTIRPMTGETRIGFFSLDVADDKQDIRTVKRIRHALSRVVGLTDEFIEKLIELDWKAAFRLADEVFIFTCEYESGLSELAGTAEKNSPADGAEQTHT